MLFRSSLSLFYFSYDNIKINISSSVRSYPIRIGSSSFVHFMVKILFYKSNGIQTVKSFKILNDVLDMYTVRSIIFNLNHKLTLSFSFQTKNPCPLFCTFLKFIFTKQICYKGNGVVWLKI